MALLDHLVDGEIAARAPVGPVGLFTIVEVRRVKNTFIELEDGEHFQWTSDRRTDLAFGGARAAPLRPWSFGGKQRTKRTDYTGSRSPSEQILGPILTPFTLKGMWDDRYNYHGFAVQEMRRFVKMCRAGNLVKIAFQRQSFICVITDWKFDYHRAWDIKYSFTVSAHDRPDDYDASQAVEAPALGPAESFDQMEAEIQALLAAHKEAPAQSISSTIKDTADNALEDLHRDRQALAATLDQQEIAVSTDALGNQISPFRRLATQFRAIVSDNLGIIDALVLAKSDIDLGVRTATSVLDFESWSRSLRFQARVVMGQARFGELNMQERDAPSAIRLYRPFAGESLYAISRRFYGTANAWRLIADRNGLTDFIMTGDELLIIPERT